MSDSNPHNLESLQKWFQAVITHPLGVEQGLASEAARETIEVAPEDVERIITRSQARTSIERMEVYGNAYFSRLMECLREQYPALVQALSEELFDQFALDYLQACPPHSYTLNDLADRFTAFLEESRPPREVADEPDWADFMIDLSRLEVAIEDVFDGPGLERETPLSVDTLLEISPEKWPSCRLVPSPALRLLAFHFPLNDYYTSYRAGEEPQIPEPQDTFLALHRRDYIVRRFELTEPQFVLLRELIDGATVGNAIAAAAELVADWESLAGELREWFQVWCAAGFFRAIEAERNDK